MYMGIKTIFTWKSCHSFFSKHQRISNQIFMNINIQIFRAVGEIYDIAGGMAVGMSYETKLKQQ
jgi:hypothetical protein